MIHRAIRYTVAVMASLLAINVAAAASAPPFAPRAPLTERRAAAYHYPVMRLPSGQTNVAQLIRALRVRHALTRAAGSVPISWTFLGPSNIGGRINAILTDPADPQHLLVGSAGGGLFVSTDAGAQWKNVDDFLASLAVSSLARAPGGTLYAGTGDQFNSPRRGVGILASTDGGQSWNPLAATDPAGNSDWYYVNHIAINPNGVMLVATGVGSNTAWGGIYRSTDGGQSFTRVAAGASLDVVFDPRQPSDAVAELENGSVITSSNAGQSWSAPVTLVSGGGRIALAFAHDVAHAGWIYALVDNSPSKPPSGEIFLSKNDGKTWAQVSQASQAALLCAGSGGNQYCQGNYDDLLWVDPTNALHLVAGGIDLFQSSDGGAQWSMIGNWVDYPRSPHADQHAIAASPGYNGGTDSTVYIGNDGGMWQATNINTVTPSSGWVERNTGLAVTQFYGVAGHAAVVASQNGGIVPVIGGTQDNGTELYNAQRTTPSGWNIIFGGDGGQTAVDPGDGNYLYGEYTNLDLFYSSDGGLQAREFSTLPTDSNGAATANFIAPFVLDPATPNAMFAGGQSLWYGTGIRSGNPTWRSLNGTTLPKTSLINAIGVSPANANAVWVGLNNGQIWASSNALAQAPTWTRVGSGVLPDALPTGISFQPGNPQEMAISYWGRTTQGNLWLSKNGGQTWADVAQGLPPVPVNSAAIDPTNASILYAGTAVGFFVSTDGGKTWSTAAAGPANVTVNQVRWFDTQSRELLLATNGRGVWYGSVGAANPAPVLQSISPASATVGAAALDLSVSGSGFVTASRVEWNGTALVTSYVSASELKAQVPASDLTQAGTAQVTVVNPAPGGGSSTAVPFAIHNPPTPRGGGGGGSLGWVALLLFALMTVLARVLERRSGSA